MAGYSQATKIAAYKQVATRGLVTESDPHRLITLLMDGALERLRMGKACIESGRTGDKAAYLHRTVEIFDELRMSLDHSVGGALSANMERLYEYMVRRVLAANLKNDVACIDEVIRLLSEIRTAWVAIPPAFHDVRKQG